MINVNPGSVILSNTVLRLNLKGQGQSILWHRPKPVIEEGQVDEYFPQTLDGFYGANVAFSGERISQDQLFLTTTSRWNLKDEYGRRGLALSQGILVTTDPEEPERLAEVCSLFEVLLKIHQVRYQKLSEVLKYLANEGSVSEAQKLLMEISNSFDQVRGEFDNSIIMSLATLLESKLEQSVKRLRVDVDFPWSESLGFVSLLGLQILSEGITSIGGGKLLDFERYQHVSSPQPVPGFEYVDLNESLAQIAPLVDRPSSKMRRSNSTIPISRMKNFLFAAKMPLSLTVAVLFVGVYLAYQQRQILKKLDTVVAEPRQSSKLSEPVSSQTLISSAKQEDTVLQQTIAQLYDGNKNVRLDALMP